MNPSLAYSIKATFIHCFIPSLLQSFIGGLHHCTIHSIVHCIIGCFIHCMKAPFTQTIIHTLHNPLIYKRCIHPMQHCIKDVFHHSCIISKQYSINAANHRFHRQFSSVSEKIANFVSETSSRGDQGLTKRNSKLCFCAYKLRSSTRKPPCPVLRTGESSHLATRYLYWNEPLV